MDARHPALEGLDSLGPQWFRAEDRLRYILSVVDAMEPLKMVFRLRSNILELHFAVA